MTLRIVIVLTLSAAAPYAGAASGFFNMPTSLPQCIGCGCGPGYHAPMVLKPHHRVWNASQRTVRANPRDYPPIYNQHAMYGAYSGSSSLGHVEQHHQPAPEYHTTPAYQPTPAHTAIPAANFTPPSIMTPNRPGARAQSPASEPASPSEDLTPDELPMPRR